MLTVHLALQILAFGGAILALALGLCIHQCLEHIGHAVGASTAYCVTIALLAYTLR